MTKGNSLVLQNTYRRTSKTNSTRWAIFSSGTLVEKLRIIVFNIYVFQYLVKFACKYRRNEANHFLS